MLSSSQDSINIRGLDVWDSHFPLENCWEPRFAEWFSEKVIYMKRVSFKGSGTQSLLLFCWGASGPRPPN